MTRRVDRMGGFVEESAIRGSNGSSRFEISYLPTRGPRMGVVVCSSILMELLGNYRREVLLARTLAARGIAAHRFHYRGAGHSGGGNDALTCETMVEDTLSAAEYFRRQTRPDILAFVGVRWGAMIASAAAARFPGSPLVLWAPVLDGARYFREMVRARLVRSVKDRQAGVALAGQWREEMRHQGWIDVLGYTLPRPLYEAGRMMRLATLVAGRTAPTLLVQLTRDGRAEDEAHGLTEMLRRAGSSVDVHVLRDDFPWFFSGDVMAAPDAVLRVTADWLEAVATEGVRT